MMQDESASLGLSLLYHLNRDCFREVCRYLHSSELLALWACNNRSTQALLGNSGALCELHITHEYLQDRKHLLQWAKIVTEPHLGRFSYAIKDSSASSYEVLRQAYLSHFIIDHIDIHVSDTSSLELLYYQWKAATSLPRRQNSVFPGTKSLCLSSFGVPPPQGKWGHNAFLELLPDSLTALNLCNTFLYGMPFSLPPPESLRNLQALTLTYDEDVIMEATKDALFLPGLLGLSQLQTFELTIIGDIKKRPPPRLFELPSSVTSISLLHPQELLLIAWPSSLTSLVFEDRGRGDTYLERFSHNLTWLHLSLNCPHLADLYYPHFTNLNPILKSDPKLFDHCRRAFEEAIGERFTSNFTSCLVDLQGYLNAPPSKVQLIQRLPTHLRSLKIAEEHRAELTPSSLQELVSSLSCFNHLSTLHLAVNTILAPFQFPPSISDLTLEYKSDVLEVKSVESSTFPPLLKRFTLDMDIGLKVLCALRKKLGPLPALVCGATIIQQNQLNLAFPVSLGASEGHPILLDEEDLAMISILPKPSSYAPCSAPSSLINNQIHLTYGGLLDALVAAVGHRTSTKFYLETTTVWPSSIASISLLPGDPLPPPFRRTRCQGLSLSFVDLQSFFNSPSLKSLTLNHGQLPSGLPDAPSVSCTLTHLDLGVHLPVQLRHFSALPTSLTVLRHLSPESFGWNRLAACLPRLTELRTPNAGCDLNNASFPSGLRSLAVRLTPPHHDAQILKLLAPLRSLTLLELNSSGLIFTASQWESSTVTRQTIFQGLKALFLSKRGLQLAFSGTVQQVLVDVSKFSPWITSVDFLGLKLWNDESLIWPTDLTALRCSATKNLNMRTVPPHLRELHLHFESIPIQDTSKLPATIESLTITHKSNMRLLDKQHNPSILPSHLPFAHILRALIVPDSFVETLGPTRSSQAANCVLPNLTRLVSLARKPTDLEVLTSIRAYLPNLERLTITSAVRLTGTVAQDCDPNVSFESLASETRRAILSTLESNYRRRVNKERSSDLTLLKSSKRPVPLDFSLENDSPLNEPESPPTTLFATALTTPIDLQADRAEFNCVFSVDLGHKEGFHLPPLATRLSLLAHPMHRSPISQHQALDYAYIDVPAADAIEEEVRNRSNLNGVHIAANFSLDTVANWSDLNGIRYAEYDSMVRFTPGTFFTQTTLTELIIHAPIDASPSPGASKWTIPPNLTRFVCTELKESMSFVTTGDEPCTALIELELPNATWRDHPLPPSLQKLVVGYFSRKEHLKLAMDKGCDVKLLSSR